MQFNRSASITIGPVAGQGINVTRLRINFVVKKTNNKEPNEAEIKVYNLSRASREELDKNLEAEEGAKVFLNAGYTEGEGEDVVFIGDVTKISHTIDRPDIITTIEAQDGQKNLSSVDASLSFPTGTSARTILQTLLNLYPNKNDLANLVFPDISIQNGFSLAGLAQDGLDKITSLLGLDYSVQNDEIRLIPLNGSNGTLAILLSATTGLINSPERINDETEKSLGKSTVKNPGWRLTSLLQPKIIPGGRVAVTSEDISANTIFTVVSVEHRGDTHVGEFNSITDVKDAA